MQIDGADSIRSSNDDNTSALTDLSDVNSKHSDFEHAVSPVQILNSTKVDKTVRKYKDSSNLPLIAVLNARSLYNKAKNFKYLRNLV